MKVNMTPNPLDVVTIHASQGDTEARQWEFELHNNGELVDTSDVKEQLVFKAYKGGTEQILPENTSTPTTSPFLGDIKYPQGLLSDQEFTYRQSPTEEDGNAKITDIKGNTLNWNQLVQNGNFADGTNNWEAGGSSTISASNGELTVTIGEAWNNDARQNRSLVAGHKYLGTFKVKSDTLRNIGVSLGQFGAVTNVRFASTETLSSAYQTAVGIATITESTGVIRCSLTANASSYTGQTFTIKDVMLFDLTQMGLDISSTSDFTSLFPLSYYSYNQGSLLSFNGNGIKTVGFNQWDEEWEVGAITAQGTPSITADRIRSKNFIPAEPNTRYFRKTPNNLQPFFYDTNQQFIEYGSWGMGNFITPSNCAYMKFQVDPVYGLTYKNDICINISNTDLNGTYEPYKESSSSLPISQYFPNGMKSAGNVYDELTESKAITRVGTVVFNGTQSFTGPTVANNFWIEKSDVTRSNNYTLTMSCDKLDVMPVSGDSGTHGSAKWISAYPNNSSSPNTNWIYVHVDGITTKEDLTTWLQANPVTLNYELKTPTETSFTTASLVTENAEIPLSNEDGTLIGKCTEQLSENPGFIDAKIKLADSDGECYSNKIQLHVERSPQ